MVLLHMGIIIVTSNRFKIIIGFVLMMIEYLKLMSKKYKKLLEELETPMHMRCIIVKLISSKENHNKELLKCPNTLNMLLNKMSPILRKKKEKK